MLLIGAIIGLSLMVHPTAGAKGESKHQKVEKNSPQSNKLVIVGSEPVTKWHDDDGEDDMEDLETSFIEWNGDATLKSDKNKNARTNIET